MDPQEDPEARIRDLERPLTDRARASELGTTPYPQPPLPTVPYPDQQYFPTPPGPTYGAPPPVSHSASRSGVLAFVGVVLALVVAGAGVLIYFAMRPSDGAVAGSPTVAGGGGLLDGPTQIPSMPVLPSGLPGLPGEADTMEAGPGQTVSVSGVQNLKEIACDDGVVNVSGVANVVTITGRCAMVSVSGVNNEITVDESATLGASGFDNTIIYRSGSPTIEFVTDSNIIRQG